MQREQGEGVVRGSLLRKEAVLRCCLRIASFTRTVDGMVAKVGVMLFQKDNDVES